MQLVALRTPCVRSARALRGPPPGRHLLPATPPAPRLYAGRLADCLNVARFPIGAEESLERKTGSRRAPSSRPQHLAAKKDLDAALATVSREGDAADRKVASGCHRTQRHLPDRDRSAVRGNRPSTTRLRPPPSTRGATSTRSSTSCRRTGQARRSQHARPCRHRRHQLLAEHRERRTVGDLPWRSESVRS